MRNLLFMGALLGVLAAAPGGAKAQSVQQQIVDRATLAVQDLLGASDETTEAQRLLTRSRAVMVCPRQFRAGFIFGGEGGDCVLVARDGGGSWSSPAFYTMGSGSIGFQVGVQDSQVMLIIMTERGLNAILDSQFRIGGDASIAFATAGVGVGGSTTTAVGADIVSFSRTRGLFAGLSLEGSLISFRNSFNREYYGREVSARGLVISMEAHNPGADPLRAVLMRFSGQGQAQAQASPPPASPANAAPRGRVQQESLPTPPRNR
jgi:lipid-binding SYLF domain-containing protein